METHPTVRQSSEGHAQPGLPRVCIIVSRYNESITGPMRTAAVAAFRARYPADVGPVLGVVEAPGAFELTTLAAAAIVSGAYEGVVTLGCVIRGETDHDRYISQAIATGLANLTIQTGIPVAFGVITANTPEQALARAGGKKGNKGAEAMDALLDTIDAMHHLYGSAADSIPADFVISRTSTDKAAAPGRST